LVFEEPGFLLIRGSVDLGYTLETWFTAQKFSAPGPCIVSAVLFHTKSTA